MADSMVQRTVDQWVVVREAMMVVLRAVKLVLYSAVVWAGKTELRMVVLMDRQMAGQSGKTTVAHLVGMLVKNLVDLKAGL